jgi:hypothetical protein
MQDRIDYTKAFAWALDMTRALHERNIIWRMLLPVVMGRYAYREFVGLIDALADEEFDPRMAYECEGTEYNNERVRRDWWNEEH